MAARSKNTSRLEAWRDIVSTKPEPELDEVSAGRDAELALRSMVSNQLIWKSASIFHSKRVPTNTRTPKRGRYEIDLVVLSHKQISAIEIKNWSGSVRMAGSSWIQERRNGQKIIHENPLRKNQQKLESLCAYLESQDIRVPETRICRVILWNRNLSIPSEAASREEIVMRHQLERFLSHQKASGFGERIMMSVLKLCLEQEASRIASEGFFGSIPTHDFDEATNAVSRLETFDKLELYGGRVLSGDTLKLKANGQSLSLKDLPSGTRISVKCRRNKIFLFFSALFGSSPLISLSEPFHSVSASSRDSVLFHAAGHEKPEEFELSRIVSITRG